MRRRERAADQHPGGRARRAHGQHFQKMHGAQLLIRGQPAPPCHVARQNLALQGLAHVAVEEAAGRGKLQVGHRGRARVLFLGHERKDVVPVGPQGESVGLGPHGREALAREHLLGHAARPGRKVEVHDLGMAREIDHHQQGLVAVDAHVGQGLRVLPGDDLHVAPAKAPEAPAHGDHALHPPQQRGAVALLVLRVHGLVVVFGIDDHRQVEALRVGAREPGVAVGRPLHGRAHSVAVAQVVVVAHADLVAVVEHHRTRQGEEQDVHQFDLAPVVLQKRGQATADAQVDARARIAGVHAVHVVALLVRDHLQGQFVVIAQKERPLRGLGNGRGLVQDVHDGKAVLHLHGHEHARHEREVEGHVTGLALAEIGDRVLWPLIGLGQEHLVLVSPVHVRPKLLQVLVGLGQVLAVGALALEEVGNGVQTHAVHAHVEPEIHDPHDLAPDVG